MRQDQRRPSNHQPVERLLDDRFVLGIDRGKRLVEDQDRRVAQQRSSDCQPLALAAREKQAALADHRGIALRQRDDEVVRVCGDRRLDDLLPRGVGLAEAQIVLDRAVEQIGVLPHDGDLGARRFRVERLEIDAADPHRARLRVVEPQQQNGYRRLSAPARPDNADALARRDLKRKPVEGLAAAAGISRSAHR